MIKTIRKLSGTCQNPKIAVWLIFFVLALMVNVAAFLILAEVLSDFIPLDDELTLWLFLGCAVISVMFGIIALKHAKSMPQKIFTWMSFIAGLFLYLAILIIVSIIKMIFGIGKATKSMSNESSDEIITDTYRDEVTVGGTRLRKTHDPLPYEVGGVRLAGTSRSDGHVYEEIAYPAKKWIKIDGKFVQFK